MITNRSNVVTTVGITVLSATIVGAAGAAEFEAFEAELVDPVAEGWDAFGYDGAFLDTYRIYATFDGPSRVIGVGDSAGIFTRTTGDGALWNSEFNGNMPATARAQVLAPETRWDTYVTIGSTNGNFNFLLVLAPTFGEQADNLAGDFTLDDSGWATWAFNPNGLTVDDRVLVAQLTVANGVAITGTDWLVSYRTDPGGPGTLVSAVGGFTIPAASGFALLGGLAAGRRRRRS